jgi:4-hydroxybenzoyl-CoA thioesterase
VDGRGRREVESWSPFVQRRAINWTDTDAARIVYTGRFPIFALEAIEALFRARLDTDWYRLNLDEGLGTPFVHIAFDFAHPVTPREELDLEVTVVRVGISSVGYLVTGRLATSGVVAFRGSATNVFVDAKTNRPTAIPEKFRPILDREAAFAAACVPSD